LALAERADLVDAGGQLAALLDEPLLVPYLCLFAIDIPLFSLAHSHRNILVGLGAFGQSARASAWRSVTRLVLVVVLVELGLSVPGAIAANIGASLAELVVVRRAIRPSLLGRFSLSVRPLWNFAAPLFFSSLSLSCFSRLDLFALKALNGTALQAGIYGAAQNLSLLPGIFAISFSPLLLSTLSRTLHVGEEALARELGRNAMRLVMGLLPLAAMIAGAAPDIVGLLFGPRFAPAAPLLAMLIVGSVALVIVSVSTAILTAAGEPGRTLALTGPLLPAALVGHVLVIPRFGPAGAAFVTTLCAGVCAVAAVLAVYRLWAILPPAGTLARTALVSALAYALAAAWATPGFLLLVKLPIIGVAAVFAYLLLGECSAEEIAVARSLVGLRTGPAHQPHEM
ncbi:MAG: lipopolysaccharide biosynthesis protein, partial [Nitrospiraceae bacterium]